MAYPDEATSPGAGIILMVPRLAEGRSVDPNWDVLGMRATRSDSLILDECLVPEHAALFRADDTRPFRQANLNWFWGSYTPVYLGVAQAAFDELRRVVHQRQPQGYAQPLAYHPDVRRRVAEISADLEAARLITYRSAWLSDTEGPTAETTAALYRAKYMVGEAVSRITRTALTLGGAHGMLADHGPFGEVDGGIWNYGYLYARALTIGGGTSEVQRNILGEKVLGLPLGAGAGGWAEPLS
jgi:alkylation response protein AidB-like acyl-CoA dehydrogenase